MSKLEFVKGMQAAAFANDWDVFQSYCADDIYYRVGNVSEATGPEAVATGRAPSPIRSGRAASRPTGRARLG